LAANGTPSAFAGGGGRDRQEQAAPVFFEGDWRITTPRSKASTIFGARDQRRVWAAWPNAKPVPTFAGQARDCGLGTLAHLGEGLSPPNSLMEKRPRQPFTEPGRDDIFAEILLQAISSVAYPRRDSAFDILLGFSKGYAEIGTLKGKAHVSLEDCRNGYG
jgi:hypothetical protein